MQINHCALYPLALQQKYYHRHISARLSSRIIIIKPGRQTPMSDIKTKPHKPQNWESTFLFRSSACIKLCNEKLKKVLDQHSRVH